MSAQLPPMGQRFPLATEFAASAVSVAAATFLTNGIDVIKVRQQLAGAESRNLVGTGIALVQQEGPIGLFRGVSPAVARGLLYGGLRIGLYTPFKHAFTQEGKEPGLPEKLAAGIASGAVSSGICNPTDLIKTRMQAAGASQIGPMAIASKIIREEGIVGLWKGTTPSMARAALLTAAQCATYDETKIFFTRRLGWEDGIGTHLAVSAVAGLVTTTVTAPVDMVKTHMFMKGGTVGPWECTMDIVRRMGIRGLFKGWGANWARQGPMTTLVFVFNEAIRPPLGLENL